jgi:aminoglycoside phosphotransferase
MSQERFDFSAAASERISHGKSAATVTRLTRPGSEAVYSKTSPISHGHPLHDEKMRYEWLHNRVSVPTVLSYEVAEGVERLYLSEVAGYPSFDARFASKRSAVVRLLAKGLRELHALPSDGCPFDMRLDTKIAMARENVANGRVDLDDLQPEHQGSSVEVLLEHVIKLRPHTEDLVVTHGDYCLPNVIVAEDCSRINGFIDIGYCGVADRYQDLALAWRSIRFNFGEEYLPLFYDEYGVLPDADKIAYYNLLDELF